MHFDLQNNCLSGAKIIIMLDYSKLFSVFNFLFLFMFLLVGTLLCVSPFFPLRLPCGGAVLHKVKTLQQWVSMRMLFHCDFYAFLANLGDYDRAGLCGEGCCAVDGGGGAEGLAIYAIEADLLVVVETGDVDETTG